jgi:hypothetical protein
MTVQDTETKQGIRYGAVCLAVAGLAGGISPSCVLVKMSVRLKRAPGCATTPKAQEPQRRQSVYLRYYPRNQEVI